MLAHKNCFSSATGGGASGVWCSSVVLLACLKLHNCEVSLSWLGVRVITGWLMTTKFRDVYIYIFTKLEWYAESDVRV